MNNFDLHMHSDYSNDGELTPKQLIEMAQAKGLTTIALSDHDCMQGIDEMIALGNEAGIRVIPAIEFSTRFNNDFECHLLGYNLDYHQPYFIELPKVQKKMIDDAFHIRIQKLEHYYNITIDEEKAIKEANGKNPWFNMCLTMFQEHPEIEDFKDYLPGGKRCDPAPVNFFWDKCQKGSPLYVEVETPDFKETVDKIHEAGGLAILAHPFNAFYNNEANLQKAIAFGIDGLEAYSNYHTAEQNEYYEQYAKEHHLLMTCGSDFHGKNKPSIEMGEYGYTKNEGQQILDAFLAKLSR